MQEIMRTIDAVAEATQRYAGTDRTLLQAPPELLSPLA